MITQPIADALFWKFYKDGARIKTKQLEDGSFVISKWEVDGVNEPNEQEILSTIAEYEKSSEYIGKHFNAEVAIGREAQVFSASDLIRLMPYSYTLNELIRFKNFWGGDGYDGLKQVLTGLVAGGQILQSDYDKLASILLEQGVVL